MAGNDRRRQKKMEKKTARRKDKKKATAQQDSLGLPALLALAAKGPILHSWISNSIAQNGIGYVIISRLMPYGMVGFAFFLIDSWCLGVKDIVLTVGHRVDYDTHFEKIRKQQTGRDVSPEDAMKLVLDAVAYARDLGFAPYKDYARAMILFEGVDATKSTATYKFGRDGKPCFASGPNDGPERIKEILGILQRRTGPKGHNFMIGGTPEFLESMFGPIEIPDDEE